MKILIKISLTLMFTISCAFSLTYGQHYIADSKKLDLLSRKVISTNSQLELEKNETQDKFFSSGKLRNSESNQSKKQFTIDSINIPSNDINIILLTGISYASDYANSISSAFESNGREVTGIKGWLNLGIGMEFRIFKSLFFTPTFAAQGSLIKFQDSFSPSFLSSGKSDMNLIYSIGYGGSYYLSIGKKSALYLNLSGLSNFGKSDDDLLKYDFGYDAKGIGYKFSIGIAASTGSSSSIVMDLGFKNIPVKINSWNSAEYRYKAETKNFGGIYLNAFWNFGLIKF